MKLTTLQHTHYLALILPYSHSRVFLLQVCPSHAVHVKGPSGLKNSAKPRAEPQFSHLNDQAPQHIQARQHLTRRTDRLQLLLHLYEGSSICVIGGAARTKLRTALTDFAKLPTAFTLVHQSLAQNISQGGGDVGLIILRALASDAVLSDTLKDEVDSVLVPVLSQCLTTYLHNWIKASATASKEAALAQRRPVAQCDAGTLQGASQHAETPFTLSLSDLPALNHCFFQPSSEWTADTWRLALSWNQSKKVAISDDERETLDEIVWPLIAKALDGAQVNAWQFVNWLNAKLPVPTTLLPIAALCVDC